MKSKPMCAWMLVALLAVQLDQAQALADKPSSPGTPVRVRVVSEQQYANSIRYVFGNDIKIPMHFPPVRRTEGLIALGAASAGLTSGALQQFDHAASAISSQVVDPKHREFLFPCTPRSATAADKQCAARFLGATGRLLFRRDLTADELALIVGEAVRAGNELKDFYAGVAVALGGMLIHPDFLLLVDRSEPDPAQPGNQRLTAASLATRLSAFLWDASPDDVLLTAVQSGELNTDQGKARLVEYMMASPRLTEGVRAFFEDMLGFDSFENLAKDASIYPAFSGQAVRDAQEQTLLTIVDHLLVQKRDYRDLFTTRSTFMSPVLAAIYQVPAPAIGWVPFEFPPDSSRAGLLTQIGFLALHSHPGRSSVTKRGKALREQLLCQRVPTPPPNVDFTLFEDPNAKHRTARERLNAHNTNPVCAGCHKITDPTGYALENFDGAGQFRSTENGATLDTSGTLEGKSFTDARGLGDALHDSPALISCLVNRLYSYALGSPVTARDKSQLEQLRKDFAEADYNVPELLRAIALNPQFAKVPVPVSPAPIAGGET